MKLIFHTHTRLSVQLHFDYGLSPGIKYGIFLLWCDGDCQNLSDLGLFQLLRLGMPNTNHKELM